MERILCVCIYRVSFGFHIIQMQLQRFTTIIILVLLSSDIVDVDVALQQAACSTITTLKVHGGG